MSGVGWPGGRLQRVSEQLGWPARVSTVSSGEAAGSTRPTERELRPERPVHVRDSAVSRETAFVQAIAPHVGRVRAPVRPAGSPPRPASERDVTGVEPDGGGTTAAPLHAPAADSVGATSGADAEHRDRDRSAPGILTPDDSPAGVSALHWSDAVVTRRQSEILERALDVIVPATPTESRDQPPRFPREGDLFSGPSSRPANAGQVETVPLDMSPDPDGSVHGGREGHGPGRLTAGQDAGVPSEGLTASVTALLREGRISRREGRSQASVGATDGRGIAINGKALRHSFDTAGGKGPLHLRWFDAAVA